MADYVSDILGGGGTSGGSTRGNRPGVSLGPLSPLLLLNRRWGGLRGGANMGQTPPVAPSVPPAVQRIRETYGNLSNQLRQMSADEAQRIAQSTGSTIRALQTIDPMAGYRETAPILSAPQASAASYLGAIGANPAQVQAQQALGNQMLASQSAGQSAFAQAMDQYAQNYRRAQESEAYTNQDRALAALNYATQAQNLGIDMARMEQENAIRKMLLDYQIALATANMKTGGRNREVPDINQVLF